MMFIFKLVMIFLFQLPAFASNSSEQDAWMRECVESSEEDLFEKFSSMGISIVEEKKVDAKKLYSATFCECSMKISFEVDAILKKQFPKMTQDQIDKTASDYFITDKGLRKLSVCASKAQEKIGSFIKNVRKAKHSYLYHCLQVTRKKIAAIFKQKKSQLSEAKISETSLLYANSYCPCTFSKFDKNYPESENISEQEDLENLKNFFKKDGIKKDLEGCSIEALELMNKNY